jgi:hypothetical protein
VRGELCEVNCRRTIFHLNRNSNLQKVRDEFVAYVNPEMKQDVQAADDICLFQPLYKVHVQIKISRFFLMCKESGS